MTVRHILSNPMLRIAMLRIATDQRTWILAGALAAAGVRVLRRCRQRFDFQGRTVLIPGGTSDDIQIEAHNVSTLRDDATVVANSVTKPFTRSTSTAANSTAESRATVYG